MLKNIFNLSDQQRDTLLLKVAEIVNEVTPERIICFGLRNKVSTTWSCFAVPSAIAFIECHLLIIVGDSDRRRAGELQDKVSGLSSSQIAICSIIFGIDSVISELSKGNDFFRVLMHDGIVLFNRDESLTFTPPILVSRSEAIEKASRIWKRWYQLGENFLDNVIHDMGAQRMSMALFHLHQVAEHTTRALIEAVTDHRPATHSIPRLLSLSKCFTQELAEIFPANTHEEGELLSTLAKGYISARYELDFSVNLKTVSVLLLRIQRLRNVAEKIYDERLAFLKSRSS